MIDSRLIACAVISIAGHFVLARALEELPPREARMPARVQIRVVEAPKPPPPPPPEPPPPEPAPLPEPPREKPRPAPAPRVAKQAAQPTESPAAPLDPTSTTADPNARPKFGVTMESTSQGRMQAPVGNTSRPTETAGPAGEIKPLAPAAAHEVTKMPLPQGRCAGKYTDAARAAGTEGVVVLDVVVDETGRTRDISVVSGLDHGLTDAAIAALRACRFSPGERAGQPVAVRVRGFKIRFLLGEGG